MNLIQLPLETTRLSLQSLSLDDAGFILDLLNSPGWLSFIGDRQVSTLKDAEAYINNIITNISVRYWVVRLKDLPEPLGIVTLIQRDYLDHPDIGFAFLPQHAGNAYAVEAAQAVLQEVLKPGNYNEVLATTVKENDRSKRLLEKLGLRFKKELIRDNDTLLLYAMTADTYQIDQLTRRFFDLFSTTNGQAAQLDRISELCVPQVLIIKKAGLTEEFYTLETFITPRKQLLSNGTLTEFEEKEVQEYTVVSGTMAQRSSVYSKKGILNHKSFEQSGHKFFQFIKTLQGWRISSLVWQDEEHEKGNH